MSTDGTDIIGDGGQPYPLVRCKTCNHKAPGNAVCQLVAGVSCGGPEHCVLCRRPVVTEDTPATPEEVEIEPTTGQWVIDVPQWPI